MVRANRTLRSSKSCICCLFVISLNESRPLITPDEIHRKRILVLRELGQVFLRDGLPDALFLLRIDQGDAGAFEACAAKATAVNARGLAEGLVDGDELGRAAFVVVDAGLAGGVAEGAEPFEVAGFPGGDAFADAFVFFVEVLRAPCEAGGHLVLVLLEQLFRHVAQEGLFHHLDRNAGEGLEVPGSGLAFGDAEVVVAVHQVAREPAEEDADLEGGHLRIAGNEAVVVALAVEHQEVVFLAQGNAGLVEEAVVEADVLPLRFGGDLHHFEGLEAEVIGLRERHDVRNQDGCAGAEAADGQGAFDHAFESAGEGESFLKGEFGAAGIVAPVALPDQRGNPHREVDVAVEGEAAQGYAAVFRRSIDQIHAFVNRKSGHQPVLVVHMGADGANPVRAEDMFEFGLRFSEEFDVGFCHGWE